MEEAIERKDMLTAFNRDAKMVAKKNVLDEEEYIERLEDIIQRDYFPDLAKLQAQNEYLDALDRNDGEKLRELHAKYCPRSRPPSAYNTPSTFETPIQGQGATTPSVQPTVDLADSTVKEKEVPSLDGFLHKFTSEDNASFGVIMEESAKAHRHKYPWLYHDEGAQHEQLQEALALTDNPERPFNLLTWKYRNKNALMYVPDGAELTPKEIYEQKEGREVVHVNTRFEKAPFNETVNKVAIAEAASVQAKNQEGKIGIDGKELMPKEVPTVQGYAFVPSTPSPAPGVAESPLMTWGEIEGTPFRLDGSDTPIPDNSGGPQFKIPDVPSRERLAHSLADRVAKQHRATKKQDALQRVRSSFHSPSTHFGSTSPRTPSERLSSMSPAAQKLARAKLGIQRTGDKALSASYSPCRSPSFNNRHSLTDDLLNLPKRKKAADFFIDD